MGMSSMNKPKEIISSFKVLNNGLKCPIIGIETNLIKNRKDIDIVYNSIIDGVRLIDTDPNNEEYVGLGIKKVINEGIVKRKDLFIIAKLELDEKGDPEAALKKSLKRLQLDYIDLYLDHWPSCINIDDPNKYKLIPVKDTWEKMETLVELNLTKSIGVCNYNVENLLNILSICKIKPVVNGVEFHPYLYQKDLKEFCDIHKIVLFAYNPLAKGEYLKEDITIFNEDILNNLKDKYSERSKAQLLLNWHMCLGLVPIPEASLEEIKEYLYAEKFQLNKNDISLLCSFENNHKHYRFNDGSKIFGINIFE